jgi:DHA2 family multidrug resistance protein
MSPIVAKLATKYDQRALASFGLSILGGVTLMRSFWTTDADFFALALPQILQGFAVPFFFIPLSNMALSSVLPHDMKWHLPQV